MKVINSKLAAIGLAAFVFASCSDSTSDGPNTPTTPDIATIGLTQSDAATLAASVSNYKTSSNAGARLFSRAAEVTFPSTITAPKEPAESEENVEVLGGTKDLKSGMTYIIRGGKSIDLTGKKMQGVTIFVHGNCSLTYDATQGGNTIVLLSKSAKLVYTGTGEMIAATDKVYTDLGPITATEENITIAGELYANWRGETSGKDKDGNVIPENIKQIMTGIGNMTKNDKKEVVDPTQNITFKSTAKAYLIGSIRAKELNIEDGAVVNTTANVMNATKVNLNGALQIGGFLKAGELNVKGLLNASDNSAIKVTGALNMEEGSKVVADYVNVTNNEKDESKNVIAVGEATLNLKKGCLLQTSDKGVINVNNLVTDNASSGQITLAGNDAVAVVKADKFTNNGDSKINAFATPGNNSILLLQITKCFNGTSEMPSAADLDIAATYLDYDKATNGNVVDLKDENNKSYGYELKIDVSALKKSPKLDLVAAAEATNNGLSASCIQKSGSNLYVTYHTYGNEKTQKGGALEILTVNGNQLAPVSYVSCPSSDFNHIMVESAGAYVAGSDNNKGAYLGYIPFEGGAFKTGDDAMTVHAINPDVKNGIDANCVVKYQNNYVVSSSRGYEIWDNTFSHKLVSKSTSVKGMAVSGNNLYALVASGNNEAGNVEVFNSDAALANPTVHATDGKVGPKYGKNTVAVDGTDYYVCQGEAGLVRYDANGNKVWSYKVPTIQNTKSEKYGNVKGYCNGVAFDNNYVYVAAGGYGLVVLNKADGKEVCHRVAFNGKTQDGKLVNPNSANYVTTDGSGNIYVAYGKSRVQVFKVTAQ